MVSVSDPAQITYSVPSWTQTTTCWL